MAPARDPATRPPWFSRAFDRVDPSLLPDLIERLRGTPARLEERIGAVPERQRTVRIGDRWSIQENVGHLLDLEPLWSGRTDDLLAGAAVLRPADLENRRTHEAQHNDGTMTRLIEEFARVRTAWNDRLLLLTATDFARTARHPRLEQPMRLIDHCVFVAEHDAHHLGRILQLRG
jgi:uncharacterized damage-inducible protein DinB